MSLKLQEQKIVNFEELQIKQRKNILYLVFKYLLIVFFGISLTTILLMSPLTIFANKILKFNSLQFFLNYTDSSQKTLSFLIIYKIILLLFILFYSVFINYNNLLMYKQNIKVYIPLYITYFSLSIISIGLIFGYFTKESSEMLNLIYILVPLFLIRLYDLTLRYSIGKKQDPTLYKSLKPLLLTLISKGILFLISITIFVIWPLSSPGLFNDYTIKNTFYTTIREIFEVNNFKNFMIIISSFVFLGILLLGNFSYSIIYLMNKKVKPESFKHFIHMSLVTLSSSLIWFIRTIFYKTKTVDIINNPINQNYFYLFLILFIVLIFIGFIFIIKKIKNNLKASLISLIVLGVEQLLFWSVYFITILVNNSATVNMINLSIIILFSLISYVIFFTKYKSLNNISSLFFITNFVIMSVTLSIFGFNQLFLVPENYNLIFYTINSNLSITQIVTAVQLASIICYLVYLLIKMIIILSTITKLSENIKGV
ncbi:Uncharacterised protein [Mycoplasmopsis maculosa]|uniref:Uncharacterized protein n=1 Tax=Mycoplasmopsis maculosa TaxID=114885 RepID=A0A449B544_9BACT|nr:hypothetical protein [Mycoplasmopsis maculosa]VEU75723.1 Uncharacterised protein [Mycoplasmopsis maculosa]